MDVVKHPSMNVRILTSLVATRSALTCFLTLDSTSAYVSLASMASAIWDSDQLHARRRVFRVLKIQICVLPMAFALLTMVTASTVRVMLALLATVQPARPPSPSRPDHPEATSSPDLLALFSRALLELSVVRMAALIRPFVSVLLKLLRTLTVAATMVLVPALVMVLVVDQTVSLTQRGVMLINFVVNIRITVPYVSADPDTFRSIQVGSVARTQRDATALALERPVAVPPLARTGPVFAAMDTLVSGG